MSQINKYHYNNNFLYKKNLWSTIPVPMQKYLALIWYDDIKRFFKLHVTVAAWRNFSVQYRHKVAKKAAYNRQPPDVHEKVKLEILSIASSSSSDLSRPFYK
jgi:hypothetical protein